MTDREASEGIYFIYDPGDNGFATFATEAERDEFAAKTIANCLDCDEWDSEVARICVGIITGRATYVRVEHRPPDSDLDENDCDEDGTQWPDGINERYDVEIVPTGQPMHILLEEAKTLLREKYAPTAEQMRTPGHSMNWRQRVSEWLHKVS